MNGAVYDSTMNVFFKLRHARLYDTVLSTPMVPADVALGEIGWAVIRGFIYSVAFLATMWALGMTGSPWVVLALPICVLIGFAFASVGMALTTFMRSWADFEYVPAVTLPLFLFSATFFPLSSYGSWAWVVQLSPLYHGVALVRAANLGQFEWSVAGARRRARGHGAGRPARRHPPRRRPAPPSSPASRAANIWARSFPRAVLGRGILNSREQMRPDPRGSVRPP